MDGDQDPGPQISSLPFVEGLYADFLKDPQAVPTEWREWFAGQARTDGLDASYHREPTFRPGSIFNPPTKTCRGGACAVWQIATLQERVDRLVRSFRVRGHLAARCDPLGRHREEPPELSLSYHGLGERELERRFAGGTVAGVEGSITLREIVERLRQTYCRSIGVQFMHIDDPFVKNWLQVRMEGTQNRLELRRDEQVRILTELTDAVIFEEFIQKKYIGAKRFSLEGAESLIPLLDLALDKAGKQGLEELVLGMAHRGRLNVLANVIGKSPQAIFSEFEDREPPTEMGGDVKYHLGYTSRRHVAGGRPLRVSLCFNPSHLEAVDPVALGRMRAKQDWAGDKEGDRGMALLIHGDAAFAGQGVVQETLNLSRLPGYATGGTLHVVVNNQIGFTTCPSEGRSTEYCTDVARMLQIPVFHVNGEDPEAVAQVVRVAMDFRRTFRRDAVIDMYCYRRYGHNETDEPAFTQPEMVRAIKRRPSVLKGYLEHLLQLGGITREEAEAIARERRTKLEKDYTLARSSKYTHRVDMDSQFWRRYRGGPEKGVPDTETGMERGELAELLEGLTRLPEDFQPHRKLERYLENRRRMATGELPLDWAAGEALAMASLAAAGHPVRLSGQDSARGTFSHRHAILHDSRDGRPWCPLQHLAEDQARVGIWNSPLSEMGVLGFDYGYSMECPEGLVIWEAQFGDFCNSAQVMVDQFIAAGEDKWKRLSGLVLFLPHGFEGQGPEHSSARLERFLQLAAEDNIQVAQPTTPAQLFHLLRRQVLRSWRKPLIVMTPKSLLRHPRVISPLEELSGGRFAPVLPDDGAEPKTLKRILMCSGKVYYDLLERREQENARNVAILRLEQLYPLRREELDRVLADYPAGAPLVWVQEEPENMGAWRFLRHHLAGELPGGRPFSGIFREASASPATGSGNRHRQEQETLLARAFART